MKCYPDLLVMNNGRTVSNADEWKIRRLEILDILSKNEYGYLPPVLAPATGKVVGTDNSCCSGHAVLDKVEITVTTEKGPFTFPINFFRNTTVEKAPLFIMLNFRPDPYDKYFPAEEIIDNGFSLAAINYNDITSDDKDMTNGLIAMFTRPDDGTGFGKISTWAYGASRALDYFITRDDIDKDHIAVIGHSRLGKTALWAGANDERFRYVFSNDSGCGGAAYNRIKIPEAETIKIITNAFPRWFCENFNQYKENGENMPFDQHFLIAASAPRYVMVHSASKDLWADPYAEQISSMGASDAWTVCGKAGYIGPEEQCEIGKSWNDGCVGYFRRDGIHFIGRHDWNNAMTFIKKHW